MVDTFVVGDAGARFTIGGVLARLVGLFRRHLGPLLVLAVVLAGVLPYGIGFAYGRIVASTLGTQGYLRLAPFQVFILLPFTTVTSLIFQGAVIHLAAMGTRGWAALGPALRTAFRLFFPNLGIYLLTGLGIVAASFLVLIPGLILIVRWWVVLPVEVVERAGVLGSLRRSRDLTEGTRWRVFGLLLILFAVTAVLGGGQLLLGRAAAGSGVPLVALSLVTQAAAIVTSLLASLGSVATYLELRRVKEGGTAGELASVFD